MSPEINEEKYYVKVKSDSEGITNWYEYELLFQKIGPFLEMAFEDGADINVTLKTNQDGGLVEPAIHAAF